MRESLNKISTDLAWKGEELLEANAKLTEAKNKVEEWVAKAKQQTKDQVIEAKREVEKKIAEAR